MQVGKGLAFLHSASIVHGDLKSSNVLLMDGNSDRRGFTAKLGAISQTS